MQLTQFGFTAKKTQVLSTLFGVGFIAGVVMQLNLIIVSKTLNRSIVRLTYRAT
jgi:hypothetical protein